MFAFDYDPGRGEGGSSTRPAIPIRTATVRVPRLSLSLKTSTRGVQPAAVRGDSAEPSRGRHRRRRSAPTSSRRCTPTSSRATSRCTRCSGSGGAVADPDILRRVFHSQQVPPGGFNRGHFSDPEVDRLIDEATQATDWTKPARAVRQSAAAHRRARAVHQPLDEDQLSPLPGRAFSGIRLTPHGGFQLPQKCLAATVELPRMKKRSRFLQVPIEPFTVEPELKADEHAREDGAHLLPGALARHRASRLAEDARRRRDDLHGHGRRAQRRRSADGRRLSHRAPLHRLPGLDRRQPLSRPARDARAAPLSRLRASRTTRRWPTIASIACTTPTPAKRSSATTTCGLATSSPTSSHGPTRRASS